MPRFVLLWHETPAGYSRPSHFDLMLEEEDHLRTWALDALPRVDAATEAAKLANHRPHYLDFEGEIGGARGLVRRVDHGTYEVIADAPERLVVRIAGAQLRGELTLAQMADDDHRWRVSLSAD
jgi:hypothetical protein